jgi:hypothetical protein
MASDPTTSEPLASFDPPLAAAVAAVLRAHGIGASEHGGADGEVVVRVPAGRREESFAVVADQMDAIRDLAAAEPADAPPPRPPAAAADDDDDGEPVIVLDVLRRYGVPIVLVLAPLLVVTLSRPSFPLAFALAIVIGGAAAIVWWREREEDR